MKMINRSSLKNDRKIEEKNLHQQNQKVTRILADILDDAIE